MQRLVVLHHTADLRARAGRTAPIDVSEPTFAVRLILVDDAAHATEVGQRRDQLIETQPRAVEKRIQQDTFSLWNAREDPMMHQGERATEHGFSIQPPPVKRNPWLRGVCMYDATVAVRP
jgi:hypothetical protein